MEKPRKEKHENLDNLTHRILHFCMSTPFSSFVTQESFFYSFLGKKNELEAHYAHISNQWDGSNCLKIAFKPRYYYVWSIVEKSFQPSLKFMGRKINFWEWHCLALLVDFEYMVYICRYSEVHKNKSKVILEHSALNNQTGYYSPLHHDYFDTFWRKDYFLQNQSVKFLENRSFSQFWHKIGLE